MTAIYTTTLARPWRFPASGRRAFVSGYRRVQVRRVRDPRELARLRREAVAWMDEGREAAE